MAKETVVVTGATGFIGGRVLQLLLEQDYNIRIVVRRAGKKETLLGNPGFKGIDKAEFAIVPDLLAPGALDEAAANADCILHLASPLPMHGEIPPERQHDELIVPAVDATLRALEAAQKSGTVKRVVVTSSSVASDPNVPPEIGMAVHVDDVALLHVLAIDQNRVKRTKSVQNFLFSQNITWGDIPKIAADKFPEAVKSGQLPANGSKKSKPGIAESSKVEKIFGHKLKPLDAMFTDLTNQYLELPQKA